GPEFAEKDKGPVEISPFLVADPMGGTTTRVVVGGIYTCFPVSFEMAYGWDPEEPAFKWLPWSTEMAWWRNGRPIRRVSLQNEKPILKCAEFGRMSLERKCSRGASQR